jgi:hypothetical protein
MIRMACFIWTVSGIFTINVNYRFHRIFNTDSNTLRRCNWNGRWQSALGSSFFTRSLPLDKRTHCIISSKQFHICLLRLCSSRCKQHLRVFPESDQWSVWFPIHVKSLSLNTDMVLVLLFTHSPNTPEELLVLKRKTSPTLWTVVTRSFHMRKIL